METEQLGDRVAEYRTDNRRRRKAAIGVLLVSAVGLGVGVPLSIAYFTVPWGSVAEDSRHSTGSGMLPGGLTMLGGLCLVVGLVLLAKAARNKDQRFEVHEHGFVHRLGETASVIGWSEITSVRQQGMERTGGPHMLGIDFRCVLRVADGSRIAFNTFTADAPRLAATIDDAVNRGTVPRRP